MIQDPLDPGQTPPPAPSKPRRKRWLWVLSLLALLGLGAALLARPLERHFTQDPALCSSCHVEAQQATHASKAHQGLACAECHESRFGENVKQWMLSNLGSAEVVPHGMADRSRCGSCHLQGSSEKWQVGSSVGHRQHTLGEKAVACAQCHAFSNHALRLVQDACQNCHKDAKTYDHDPTQIACGSCHSFIARGMNELHAPAYSCQRCHGDPTDVQAGLQLTPTVPGKLITAQMVHGQLQSCGLCHQPHEADPVKRLIGQDCSRCHKVTEHRHKQALADKFSCTVCHTVHGPRAELTSSCSNCHDQSKGSLTQTLVPQHKACASCHKAHVFTATLTGCTECHEQQASLVATWDAVKHANCLNCHRPHGTQSPAASVPALGSNLASCQTCHDGKQHNQHPACVTCHEPHGGRAQVLPCAGCHEGQVQALRGGPPAHAQKCQNCHATHSPAAGAKSCSSCHAPIAAAVVQTKTERHDQCASCHAPHRFNRDVKACSDCHRLPEPNLHNGDCRNCHTPHGAPLGKAQVCSNCHQSHTQKSGPHSQCKTCHTAHGADRKPPPCSQCHAAEVKSALAWPVPAHRDCAGCHQSHEPKKPACSQCHQTEVSSNVGSGHQCRSCHQVHQAPPPTFWATCNDCHAQVVSATRPRGPIHSDCKACHKPHQPASPTCQSCHSDLPSAHRFPSHQVCANCHETHAASRPTREACLNCHKDLRDHQPQAPNCATCHIFR